MARPYAQYLGIVLVVVGLLGLILGEEPLFGLLNIELIEDSVHILTGAILAYVGFRVANLGTVRTVVGVLGVIYLLVGVLGLVSSDLFDLLAEQYTVVDNVIHLAVGVAGIALGWFVGRPAPATA